MSMTRGVAAALALALLLGGAAGTANAQPRDYHGDRDHHDRRHVPHRRPPPPPPRTWGYDQPSYVQAPPPMVYAPPPPPAFFGFSLNLR